MKFRMRTEKIVVSLSIFHTHGLLFLGKNHTAQMLTKSQEFDKNPLLFIGTLLIASLERLQVSNIFQRRTHYQNRKSLHRFIQSP